jgi:uncharacterized membrane protein YhhN
MLRRLRQAEAKPRLDGLADEHSAHAWKRSKRSTGSPGELTELRTNMLRHAVFAVYAIDATLDLAATVQGWDGVRSFTKPPLMLLLAAFVALSLRPLDRFAALAVVALLLAACGDTFLLGTTDGAFMAGLIAFLLAHLCYTGAFVMYGGGLGLVRQRPLVAAPYVAAWLGLNAVLWPHLGPMRAPVVVYSLVLTSMALAALDLVGRMPARSALLCASGALVFMLSDTLLAFGHFVPGAPAAPFAVMATYVIAQTAIALGVTGWGAGAARASAGRQAAI